MSLPSLNLDAIAVEKANPINAVGIVGNVTTKEINGGYTSVTVPLYYAPEESGLDTAQISQLAETLEAQNYEGAKELGLRTFTARWNLREEWFDPEFRTKIDAGLVEDNEKMQYSINMTGLTRGLFKAARKSSVDFAQVPGAIVGFKATAGKKEPDRLQIRSFFPPKR